MAPPGQPDGAETQDQQQVVGTEASDVESSEVVDAAGQSAETNNRLSIEDTSREEVMAVIRGLFSDGIARDRETSIRDLARALGFQRTGSRIQEIIHGDLKAAAHRRILRSERGLLLLDCRSVHDYDREFLKKTLLSIMGKGWWDQTEAIRAAARSLGFLRTGSSIQQAFKSAINGAIRSGAIERNGSYLRKAERSVAGRGTSPLRRH